MSQKLKTEIQDDIEAAKQIRLPWWVLLSLGIGSLPVYWYVDHVGRPGVGLPIVNSILVIGFTISVKWKLRRHSWFWAVMAILAGVHVLLILFVPWPTNWVPALTIAVIGSGDLIVMLAILAVVERLIGGPTSAAQGSGQ